MVQISDNELAILATAVAVVQKDSERRRGFVFCTDAKLRRFTKLDAVDLLDRLGQLAGHEAGKLKRDGLDLAAEVQRG